MTTSDAHTAEGLSAGGRVPHILVAPTTGTQKGCFPDEGVRLRCSWRLLYSDETNDACRSEKMWLSVPASPFWQCVEMR